MNLPILFKFFKFIVIVLWPVLFFVDLKVSNGEVCCFCMEKILIKHSILHKYICLYMFKSQNFIFVEWFDIARLTFLFFLYLNILHAVIESINFISYNGYCSGGIKGNMGREVTCVLSAKFRRSWWFTSSRIFLPNCSQTELFSTSYWQGNEALFQQDLI